MTQDRLSRLIDEGNRDGCSENAEERAEELRSVAEEVRPTAAEDARVLSALADETRCVLIHVLSDADGELCVCELEPVVDVSESAVSHALSDLAEAGLVERRKEGKWRYYRTTDRAEAVLNSLEEFR